MSLRNPLVMRLIELALAEDLGPGDVTTELLIDPTEETSGWFLAKEDMVFSGLPLVAMIYERAGVAVTVKAEVQEGEAVTAGKILARVAGGTRALLTLERVCLNFLQRCSGVSTLTRQYVERAAGKATILDTRKTVPGWRLVDKYAVRMGGATNHRMGLYDGVMIKDNHLIAAGGIKAAVTKYQAAQPYLLKCEVEVETLAELTTALEMGVDVVLLDNMTPDLIKAALELVAGRCIVEISGGVRYNNLPEFAALGVDMISIGALTHQARAVDISFELDQQRKQS